MWPRRSTAKSWPIFLTRNAMKEIKYLVCSLFLSLFSTRQDQPPLPVGGVAFQQQSHTIQNNSPSYRSATKVIVEGVGRWGCRRQRIGQRGFQFNFESHPNTFLETTAASQCSFFRCSINLGRYNMIFVETSAKDNTGVEQVTIFPFNIIAPHLVSLFAFWAWLISGLQAFLELVDRVLQSPGIWSPGQGLANVAPSQARPPILGWANICQNGLEAWVSLFRPQQRRTSSPPPCCGT